MSKIDREPRLSQLLKLPGELVAREGETSFDKRTHRATRESAPSVCSKAAP
jgi:hypothetical protein